MDAPEKHCWYCPTPAWLVFSSLAVTGLLWLSNWLGWWHKGYAVLIAAAGVGVVLVAMGLWVRGQGPLFAEMAPAFHPLSAASASASGVTRGRVGC